MRAKEDPQKSDRLVDEGDWEQMVELGALIRRARTAKGWSRRQLALASGVSERFLASMETGDANPSIRTVNAIGRAFENNGDFAWNYTNLLLPRLVKQLSALSIDQQAWVADQLVGRVPGFVAPEDATLRIALIGLRGAGKTTIGQALAKQLGVKFVELDRTIEERTQLPLAQIFELHGEAYYRRAEREALSQVLALEPRVVIATGGGLPSQPETFAKLKQSCRTVWLRASPEEHLQRVLKQGDKRPMEQRPHALAELKALLAAREPAYRGAEFTVDTSRLTPERVVEKIAHWLQPAAKASRATKR